MPDMDSSSIFYQFDVYWIVLIIGAIFMFISSVSTIIVLCLLWRRHQKTMPMNNQPNGSIPFPVQFKGHPLQNYETQKMEIFVPQDDVDTAKKNLGEYRPRAIPEDDIQQMHPYYQKTNKAYF